MGKVNMMLSPGDIKIIIITSCTTIYDKRTVNPSV